MATDARNVYQSPLTGRYASKEMTYNFSEQKKFTTWRKLWLTLAEVQKVLNIQIQMHQFNHINLYNMLFHKAHFYTL